MRPARWLCSMLCRCDHPHLCRQSSPHATPGAQPFLSIYFYSQANSISPQLWTLPAAPFPRLVRFIPR